jgi:hypothetical protein
LAIGPAFAAIVSWTSAFIAGAARTTAWTARTVRAAWTTRRTHLFQLFHLVSRQDLGQLGLGVGFQSSQLFQLISGQVESLRRARG